MGQLPLVFLRHGNRIPLGINRVGEEHQPVVRRFVKLRASSTGLAVRATQSEQHQEVR
jgi:hypothetical protein